MAAIETIRNLGPAMAEAFAKAGITTAEEIREMGADAAYEALLATGHRPHFIGYYVLHMGLQGRPWNDCQGEEKAKLRKSFDAMKARVKPRHDSEIERFLDAIGVRKA